MKIVHIEDFFHPEAGYQINILPKYMVRAGHEVTIITSEADKAAKQLTGFFGTDGIAEKDFTYTRDYGVKIIRLPLRAFISGRAVFTSALYRTIENEKPDVLFIHGNDTLTGMRCLLRRKKLGCPMVMDSHMLEMASKNRFKKAYRQIYRKIFTPIILKNNIPVIRTQNDPYVEKCLGIPLEKAPWISVGSDTMLFHPDEARRAAFRKEHRIPEKAFVALYAGKLDEDKGGMLLANALCKPFTTGRELVFVIVGKTVGEYGLQVEKMLSKSANRILRFPTQKYAGLAEFYQAADAALFPKQCSLSFYDVQACGLPVVFEDNSVNVDRAAYDNALLFRAGDAEDFRAGIMKMAAMPARQYDSMRRNAVSLIKKSYDYADIAQQYMDCLTKTVQQYWGERGRPL